MVEPLGGVGFQLDRSNENKMSDVFRQANELNQQEQRSVLINCLIGRTNFREGSVSV